MRVVLECCFTYAAAVATAGDHKWLKGSCAFVYF